MRVIGRREDCGMHAIDEAHLHDRVIYMPQEVEKVRRAESNPIFVSNPLCAEQGLILARLCLRCGYLRIALPNMEGQVVIHLLREVMHATGRREEFLGRESGPRLDVLRNDLLVVWKLAVDEPGK